MNSIRTLFRTLGHIGDCASHEEKISAIADPPYVCIPLEYPGQILYKPLVQAGDTVRRNQIIGRSGQGNCVHASVSGTVKEIRPVWTARSYNVPSVVIERNGGAPLSVGEVFEQYGVRFASASRIQKMKALGVVSPWTLPGKFHREEEVEEFPEVRQIIIKGKNEEPSIFTFELLLEQESEKVTRGIQQLTSIAPNALIWLTVPRRLAAWARETFGDSVKVAPLGDGYKDRLERLLVPRLTGITIANTAPYRQEGIAVISVEYLLAMVDALEGRSPFTHKHLTVAGHNVSRPVTVKFPIGTPIRTLLESQQLHDKSFARLLVGGPMKGIAQFSDETPLTKSCHGLYVISADQLPLEVNLTCINCGRCTRACPLNLQVHLIGRYVEYNLLLEARGFHPEACNECGLCAYVCPAHRPLVQLITMCNQYDEHADGQNV
ncbi:MAG TPA: 4Fe-4S dicluster domain-containing protein [Acidobacteriota bacterium]|nr:4Fe-4S dicluster domain-containing protein [Acidobacteriota bacterium]